MIRIGFALFVLAVSIFLTAPTLQAETSPLKAVNSTTDRVIEILKDKEMMKAQRTTERRNTIRKSISEVFDFEEMAKRALAAHWQKRTPNEKREFTALFADLLERSYIKKIESYSDEKIDYLSERIEGDSALVRSRITTKRNLEIPIDYRLLKKNDKWMVYDVIIEGVSLVNNYRTQFNRVIRQQSYEDLVRRMQNKQEEELFSEKK